MFKAICRGIRKTAEGAIQATVEVTNDDEVLVDRVLITAANMDAVEKEAENLLTARLRAEQDATLQAHVGRLLASV